MPHTATFDDWETFNINPSSLLTDSDITANNANPDETNHLLRIYTACRSVIDFELKSFFAIMCQYSGIKFLFIKPGVNGLRRMEVLV